MWNEQGAEGVKISPLRPWTKSRWCLSHTVVEVVCPRPSTAAQPGGMSASLEPLCQCSDGISQLCLGLC